MVSVMKKIMGKINEFFGEYYKSFGERIWSKRRKMNQSENQTET